MRFVVARGVVATQDASLATAMGLVGGFAVTNKALASNVATLTVPGHNFVVGQAVTVAGVDSVFNGSVTLTAVTSTTISYAVVHADIASVAATGEVIGESVTVTDTLNPAPDGSVTRIWQFADPEPSNLEYQTLSNTRMLSEAFSLQAGVGGSLFWKHDQALAHARTVSQGA